MIIENISLSRRTFLNGILSTGAFVVASRLMSEDLLAQNGQTGAAVFNTKADTAALHPSVYLGIEPNGNVFIVTHRSEMGTGIRTSLPLVAADELDADWNQCRIEQGVGDTRYGDQNTDGSRSIRDFYDAFRAAGASARSMLVTAAATQLNVPAGELTTANHEVVHAKSGKKVGYGALVAAAGEFLLPLQVLIQTDRQIFDHRVLHAEAPLELGDQLAVRGFDLEIHIHAFAVLGHAVGELARAPLLDFFDLAALLGAGVLERGDDFLDLLLRRRGPADEDQIV